MGRCIQSELGYLEGDGHACRGAIVTLDAHERGYKQMPEASAMGFR